MSGDDTPADRGHQALDLDAARAALGGSHVARHQDLGWREFVTHMVERYPAFVDEFEALERMAPADDRPALEALTRHEVAAIDFANRELAGEADRAAPLRAYIDSPVPRARAGGAFPVVAPLAQFADPRPGVGPRRVRRGGRAPAG